MDNYERKIGDQELVDMPTADFKQILAKLRTKQTGRLTQVEFRVFLDRKDQLKAAALVGGKIERDSVAFGSYAIVDGIRYDVD